MTTNITKDKVWYVNELRRIASEGNLSSEFNLNELITIITGSDDKLYSIIEQHIDSPTTLYASMEYNPFTELGPILLVLSDTEDHTGNMMKGSLTLHSIEYYVDLFKKDLKKEKVNLIWNTKINII